MKLLRFLERRLEQAPPKSQLHRWVRTGQVRVNGGRAKPFQTLCAGDAVRIPPFATKRIINDSGPATDSFEDGTSDPARCPIGLSQERIIHDAAAHADGSGSPVRVLAETGEILALFKPAGLACQSGTGTPDSVSQELRRAFAGRRFIPAPAHRLDKDTSGIVLAGKTLAAQKRLHELFAHGGIVKEYLAWIAGIWPHEQPCLLEDILAKQTDDAGRESMAALAGGRTLPLAQESFSYSPQDFQYETKDAREAAPSAGLAACVVLPVEHRKGVPHGGGPTTLLLIRLLTGRKHQIRVQLGARGCPIVGDRRYAGAVFPLMLLHSYAICIPPGNREAELSVSVPPPWPEQFMPGEQALAQARLRMADNMAKTAFSRKYAEVRE